MITRFNVGDKVCVRVKIKEIYINSNGEILYDTFIDGRLGVYTFREDQLIEEIQDEKSYGR